MKNKLISLFAFLAVLVLLPTLAQAQTTTYQTITSAAVDDRQLCFVLASTTNIHASGDTTGPGGAPQEWDLWFDGEFTKINTVNTTSNQVCVTRGKSPTRAGKHATASIVFFGPAGLVPFILGAPVTTNPGITDNKGQFGSCVSTNYAFLPLINVADGAIWNCLASGKGSKWESYSFRNWTSGHPVVTIVDAAYTATLADEFINYNSITTTRILTLPAITGVVGKTIVVLNDGTASNTITVTPVNGQTIGPAAATTLAVTGPGIVARLISVLNGTSTWSWETW